MPATSKLLKSAILALVLAVTGCATSSSVRPSDGQSYRIEDRSYSEVWNAAILAVASVGAIESQYRHLGEVRGHRGASIWSWGEAVAVFISPPDEDSRNFIVTVVSEHIVQTQLTGQDFESTMISMMKAHLALN